MKKVFLSHNHADKSFTKKLARDLENHGVEYWLDEAEMNIGDSLIQKIREGIDKSEFFAVILSPNSVNAPWVNNELDVAMNYQIAGKNIKVLPIMLKECALPSFLVGKFYADFTEDSKYEESFKKLITTIGMVYNKNAINGKPSESNLAIAIDKAISNNLPIFHTPFYRPFQYIGMTITQVENLLKVKSNNVGNLVIENDECYMFLEAEGNFVAFITVDIKRTAPHFQNIEFDSEPILGAFSMSISELELVRKATHCHTYSDHRKRLKITVACLYDGSPLSISISSKNYGI